MQRAALTILAVGGSGVTIGELSVANLISVIMYVFLRVAPLGQLSSSLASLNAALSVVDRIWKLISIASEHNAARKTGPASLGQRPISIEFEDVSFGYIPRYSD